MKKILIFITAIFLSIGVFGQDLNYVNLRMMKAVINSKADTSLSNLSSVAINSNLLPNAAGTIDLGSATLPFDDLHLDTASQINFHNGDITATHSDGTLTFAGGNIVLPSTTSIGDVSATEIGYVNGVTSAIQTQLNLKADTAGAIDIGDVAILLGDTLYSQNPAYYTQRQVDSILAGFSSWDSTYIYARHDSLLAAFVAYKAIVDPLLPPYFVSAEVGTLYSDTIVVTLSKTVVQDSIPDDEDFMFTEGVGEIDVTNVAITNEKVYLALALTPQKDSTLLLDYTRPVSGRIQDGNGSTMPSFVNSSVTNNGLDAPIFSSAEIGTYNDSIIVVKVTGDLLADSTAAVANFSVKEGVATMGIEAITISNDTVFIALDSLASGNYAYTIAYTRGPKYLQDASGYYVPSWTAQSVTNNITPLILNTNTKIWLINDVANFTMNPADSLVTQWDDMSGNANHLLQPSGTDIPKYMGTVGVRFDGVDDYMYDNSFADEDTLMLYAVIKIASHANYDQIFRFANTGFKLSQIVGANQLQVTQGVNSVNTAESYYSFDNYYILRVAWNYEVSSGSFIRLNASAATTGTLAAATTAYFRIGNDGSDVPVLYIKEFILRSKVDTEGDQTTIVNYLNSKYSVY